MKPSIGRIVHYQAYGTPVDPSGKAAYKPEPRAAIVTEVCDDSNEAVGLAVLTPQGMFFNRSVPYSEEPKPGHWSWPPRVS